MSTTTFTLTSAQLSKIFDEALEEHRPKILKSMLEKLSNLDLDEQPESLKKPKKASKPSKVEKSKEKVVKPSKPSEEEKPKEKVVKKPSKEVPSKTKSSKASKKEEDSLLQVVEKALSTTAAKKIKSGAFYNANTKKAHAKTAATAKKYVFYKSEDEEVRIAGEEDSSELEEILEGLANEGVILEKVEEEKKTNTKSSKKEAVVEKKVSKKSSKEEKVSKKSKKEEKKPSKKSSKVSDDSEEGEVSKKSNKKSTKGKEKKKIEVLEIKTNKDGILVDDDGFAYDKTTSQIYGMYDTKAKNKVRSLTDKEKALAKKQRKQVIEENLNEEEIDEIRQESLAQEGYKDNVELENMDSEEDSDYEDKVEKVKDDIVTKCVKEANKEAEEEDSGEETQEDKPSKKETKKMQEEIEEEEEADDDLVNEIERDLLKGEEEEEELNVGSNEKEDFLKIQRALLKPDKISLTNKEEIKKRTGVSIERINELTKKFNELKTKYAPEVLAMQVEANNPNLNKRPVPKETLLKRK